MPELPTNESADKAMSIVLELIKAGAYNNRLASDLLADASRIKTGIEALYSNRQIEPKR